MSAVQNETSKVAQPVMDAFLTNVADDASVFFMPNQQVANQCRAVVKATFDATSQDALKKGLLPLPELYVDGFDTDQIWAELDMQHQPLLQFADRAVRKMLRKPHKVVLPVPEESDDDDDDDEDDDDDGGDGEQEVEQEVGEEEEEEGASDADAQADASANGAGGDSDGGDAGSEADAVAGAVEGAANEDAAMDSHEDPFFTMADMEQFADAKDDEDLDLLRPDADGVAGAQDPYSGPRYEDMFGTNDNNDDDDDDANADQGGEGDEEEDEDEDEEDADETPFQRQQRQMKQRIEELEQEALADKAWQLTGEVKSAQRPENSLLETVMEYDQATAAAPEITAEATAALEDVIKQRIRDELWDDVERKVPDVVKRAVELPDVSTDASKLGLGEIYEQEYLKQTGANGEAGADDGKEQLRNEIRGLFKDLCGRLDALSNFAYTPKPVVPDMDIKPNVAAIQMEEVIPTAVSDARLQAPEEVYRKKRGREAIVVGDDELTREEKRRRRRARKAAKSKRHRQADKARKLVAKVNPGMGNKYAKEEMLKELGAAKNVSATSNTANAGASFKSTKFFAALQSQVQAQVAGHRDADKAKGKASNTANAAATYKL